jgi:hypothetical protein
MVVSTILVWLSSALNGNSSQYPDAFVVAINQKEKKKEG